MKIHFREKYMKKKGILVLASELEEALGEEEDIEYQSFNAKDDFIQVLCNNADMRHLLRDFLLRRETILVVESEEKRFFGKFASKDEKQRFKEANPDINVLGTPKKKNDL
jgi:hypothetical protein